MTKLNLQLKKKIFSVIKNNKPKKFAKLVRYFDHDYDNSILTFETVINEILSDIPELHTNMAELFTYLFLSNQPSFFQIPYECMLSNYQLYSFLQKSLNYESEDEFYGFLLVRAEKFIDKQASDFALSAMIVLYDSFGPSE